MIILLKKKLINRITYDYGNGHYKSFLYDNNIVIGDNKKSLAIDKRIDFDRDYERESINRAKRNLYHIAHANEWEYFGTLTIDQKKLNRYDYDLYKNKLTQFFNYWRKKYAPNLKYLFVLEPHKDGAWHSHFIASNIGDFVFVKTDDYDSIPFYTLGRNTIELVKDTERVASYIISYIAKDLNIPKGKQRYCISQNLNKPIITKDNIPFSDVYEFDENITVNYIKDIKGYFNMKIIDFSVDF